MMMRRAQGNRSPVCTQTLLQNQAHEHLPRDQVHDLSNVQNQQQDRIEQQNRRWDRSEIQNRRQDRSKKQTQRQDQIETQGQRQTQADQRSRVEDDQQLNTDQRGIQCLSQLTMKRECKPCNVWEMEVKPIKVKKGEPLFNLAPRSQAGGALSMVMEKIGGKEKRVGVGVDTTGIAETLLAEEHSLHSCLDKPIPEPQSNSEIMVENGSEIIGESSGVMVEERSGNIVAEENGCGGAAKSSSEIEAVNRSVMIVRKSGEWEDVGMIDSEYIVAEELGGSVGTEKDYCVGKKRIQVGWKDKNQEGEKNRVDREIAGEVRMGKTGDVGMAEDEQYGFREYHSQLVGEEKLELKTREINEKSKNWEDGGDREEEKIHQRIGREYNQKEPGREHNQKEPGREHNQKEPGSGNNQVKYREKNHEEQNARTNYEGRSKNNNQRKRIDSRRQTEDKGETWIDGRMRMWRRWLTDEWYGDIVEYKLTGRNLEMGRKLDELNCKQGGLY